MDDRIRNAIARIDVGEKRSTGFLVGDRLVLTAMHAVGDRKTGALNTEPIRLTFPGGEATATVRGDFFDALADWALLDCEQPAGVEPLPLAELERSDAEWETFGFPEANPFGMVQRGNVRNRGGELGGAPAYQLYSEEAAAGGGAPVPGLSGGPVIVDGYAVGLLRFALMDSEKKTVAGTLYACPAAALMERCGEMLTLHQPDADPFGALKRVCCTVGTGTGYLIGDGRVATASSIVAGSDTWTVRFLGVASEATVEETDGDRAVLRLADPPPNVSPLPLGECRARKAPWIGFGFSNGQGIPLEGVVVDPAGMTLSSPQLPGDIGPLVGAPIIVGGAVIGQLARAMEFGVVGATPASGHAVETPAVAAPVAAGEAVRIQYHTSDHARASDLANRLAGLGFSVALDTGQPRPGTIRVRDHEVDADRELGGDGLNRLVYLLQEREPPDADAPEQRALAAETRATDELAVRAAAAGGEHRLLALWDDWHATGMPDGAAALLVAQALIGVASPHRALDVLDAAGENTRAAQLRALALGRLGRDEEAIEILSRIEERDVETAGILAGCYKRIWNKSGQNSMLQSSYETYRERFEATGDAYLGVNAAALALQLGDSAESRRIAERVRIEEPADAWQLATRAEAHLLAGETDEARKWYAKAVAEDPAAFGNIAVMRRQARLDLEALGQDKSALDDVLEVPRVVAFTGHMVDKPGREPARFPAEKVGAVRAAIRKRLDQIEAGFGFASGAQGSDILFLEELLERGGRALVLLPFSRKRFEETSVDPDWLPRFTRLMENPHVQLAELDDATYDDCNREISRRAIELAKSLDEPPTLVAVWNGAVGDGPGGTADAVRAWQMEGHALEQIDIETI